MSCISKVKIEIKVLTPQFFLQCSAGGVMVLSAELRKGSLNIGGMEVAL
jgi:hypothetical protein